MHVKSALPILSICILLAACDLAQGIFQGGFIIGLIVAVIVIGLLFKVFRGRGKAP